MKRDAARFTASKALVTCVSSTGRGGFVGLAGSRCATSTEHAQAMIANRRAGGGQGKHTVRPSGDRARTGRHDEGEEAGGRSHIPQGGAAARKRGRGRRRIAREGK
jgi:hypothetical protein